MQLLDAASTARALPYPALVPAIAQAARELASGSLSAPERLVVPLGGDGFLLAMPAVGADIGITKLITVQPGNPAQGLPAIQGEVVVLDAGTGQRLLLADGPTVTARRTAAVTLLGIDVLAASPPRSALLIGTGVQAEAHLEAMATYLGIRRFWIAGTRLQRAEAFVERMRSTAADLDMTAVDCAQIGPEGLGSDVVVSLTTSRTPVVPARLPPATLAIGVGAFRPDMAELPAQLLRERRIVVDHLHGAQSEAGDLLQAGIDWNRTVELSQALDAASPTGERPVPVFKTVGHAAWDLAAARVILQHRG